VFGYAGALTPLFWLFKLLAFAAFVAEAWAFIDALRRPAPAFVAAGKQTKPLWLIILGVATVIGLASALPTSSSFAIVSLLPIAAFVAAAIYLTDVRPKVKDFGGGTSSGPYGPW
jgi:predicted membrane metal-binding protein